MTTNLYIEILSGLLTFCGLGFETFYLKKGGREGVWYQPNQFKDSETKRRGNRKYQLKFILW